MSFKIWRSVLPEKIQTNKQKACYHRKKADQSSSLSNFPCEEPFHGSAVTEKNALICKSKRETVKLCNIVL